MNDLSLTHSLTWVLLPINSIFTPTFCLFSSRLHAQSTEKHSEMFPSEPTLFHILSLSNRTCRSLPYRRVMVLEMQGHPPPWHSHQLSLTEMLPTHTHTHTKLTIWRGNSIWWKTGTVLGGVRLIKRLWPFWYWNAFFNPADKIILGLYLCSWTYFKHSPLLSLYYILSSAFGIQFHYWRLISYILPFCHSVYCVAGILRLAVPTYPLTLLYNEELMHQTTVGLCAAVRRNWIFVYSWSKLISLSKDR